MLRLSTSWETLQRLARRDHWKCRCCCRRRGCQRGLLRRTSHSVSCSLTLPLEGLSGTRYLHPTSSALPYLEASKRGGDRAATNRPSCAVALVEVTTDGSGRSRHTDGASRGALHRCDKDPLMVDRRAQAYSGIRSNHRTPRRPARARQVPHPYPLAKCRCASTFRRSVRARPSRQWPLESNEPGIMALEWLTGRRCRPRHERR